MRSCEVCRLGWHHFLQSVKSLQLFYKPTSARLGVLRVLRALAMHTTYRWPVHNALWRLLVLFSSVQGCLLQNITQTLCRATWHAADGKRVPCNTQHIMLQCERITAKSVPCREWPCTHQWQVTVSTVFFLLVRVLVRHSTAVYWSLAGMKLLP
jgi:hypothetical protein